MIDVVVNGPADSALDADDAAGEAKPDVIDTDEGEDGADHLPKSARRGPDETVILKLRRPVTLTTSKGDTVSGQRTFNELTFYPMTGADLRAVAASSEETRLPQLIARATREKLIYMIKLFDKLDARDARDATACAGFFFGNGGMTGR